MLPLVYIPCDYENKCIGTTDGMERIGINGVLLAGVIRPSMECTIFTTASVLLNIYSRLSSYTVTTSYFLNMEAVIYMPQYFSTHLKFPSVYRIPGCLMC